MEEPWRKSKEGENMKEPHIELPKTYDEESLHEEVNVELMNMENVLSGLENHGLTDDEVRLIEGVTRSFEKKHLKSKLNELNNLIILQLKKSS